jgi:hypothetical protein
VFSTQQHRRSQIVFGTVFGAWLGGIYALFSQAVNWIGLPGVPLAGPDGGLAKYILTYIFLGAALGLVSSIPSSTGVGVMLGGLLGSFLAAVVAVMAQWGDVTVIRTMILLLYAFFPLAVLLMPLAYLIRRGVDAQVVDLQAVDPQKPYLWARRFLIPALLTLIVIGLAAFSLYSGDVRRAFRYTHEMVQAGMQARSRDDLPQALQTIAGFRENVTPGYEMYWSDNAEEFFGPRPATGEMSQFLIYTQFENGFRIACVFSATTTVPNCTNQ